MINFTKRVITLCGKRTSLRLSECEWQILENICRRENMRRNQLLSLIKDNKSTEIGLTYAVRLFMLIYGHKNISPLLYLQHGGKIKLDCLLNLIR